MKIENLKKVTLAEQVMDQIGIRIASGELKKGEKLPNERDLAAMFGVTRNCVREALRALSLVGVIDIRPGGGSFVTDNENSMISEAVLWMYHKEMSNIEDIYAARRLIETAVYFACFDHCTDEIVATMNELWQGILESYEEKEPIEKFMRHLDNFDIYVGHSCGNSVFDKLMQTMILLRRESSLHILQSPGAIQRSVNDRQGILEAFVVKDRSLLKRRLKRFFQISVKNLRVQE